MSSASRPGLAKEDMSTDNQGDASGDAAALKESRETAEQADNIMSDKGDRPGALFSLLTGLQSRITPSMC